MKSPRVTLNIHSKRHYDDSLKPVWRFLTDGKIVGLNAWYDKSKKSDGLLWDEPVPEPGSARFTRCASR